jgi:hypothetical protein
MVKTLNYLHFSTKITLGGHFEGRPCGQPPPPQTATTIASALKGLVLTYVIWRVSVEMP